jgi:XTP/dITP diphosphohydrolase
MKLIFATNNANKIAEIKSVLTGSLQIVTLTEAGINIDIPEPHNTIEANATEKANVIYALTKTSCFSEDTGLEVAALQGAPGVKSARYAGEPANDKNNIALLLKNLKGITERAAQFKTVISLIIDGKEQQFVGICKGKIINETIGDNGFGYDPIFIPDGATKTFAEMTMDEKNKFSHRKKALVKLIDYLNTLHA